MKKLSYILLLILVSCNLIKPKPLDEYKGCIVIDKHMYEFIDPNDVEYYVIVNKLGHAYKVKTYKYYFQAYNIGDTIK